jgi:hypothetical protein
MRRDTRRRLSLSGDLNRARAAGLNIRHHRHVQKSARKVPGCTCKRRRRPEHTLRTVPFLGDLRGKKTEPCRPRIRGNVTNSENGTLKVFPAKTRTIFNVFFPNWHRHAGVGFVRLGAKTKEWDTK